MLRLDSQVHHYNFLTSEHMSRGPENFDKNTVSKNSQVDSLELSESAKKMGDAERDIAHRYDVEAITEQQMVSLATELKDAGLITSNEYAVMSFPREKARERLGVITSPNQNQNALRESKDKLNYMISNAFGTDEIKIQNGIYTALQRLHDLSS